MVVHGVAAHWNRIFYRIFLCVIIASVWDLGAEGLSVLGILVWGVCMCYLGVCEYGTLGVGLDVEH